MRAAAITRTTTIVKAGVAVLTVCLGIATAGRTNLAAAEARGSAAAGEMTNAQVIALYRAKYNDDAVVRAIRSASDTRFDLRARAIEKLKRAGVPEAVIGELRQASAEQARRLSLARATTAFLETPSPGTLTPAQFADLRAEVVRWNRFKILDDPRRADVTIVVGPTYSAAIHQRDSGTVLWTATGRTRAALIAEMRTGVPDHPPTLCVAIWCR